MKFETGTMDLSSAIKILGKGGGYQRWWNWDCKLSFGDCFNGASSNDSNTSGVRTDIMNDFLRKSGKVLLCLFILFLHGPVLVSCDTLAGLQYYTTVGGIVFRLLYLKWVTQPESRISGGSLIRLSNIRLIHGLDTGEIRQIKHCDECRGSVAALKVGG
ncbi:hypothetical protein AVEN_188160-1 [Araneus ventricosus]|uniref:Uncharacterized protein n=1 Tax=Araneus ventricosus TaxID=182803 RepID=A0A4Y2U514_ARAVE|nr:hypothetical protein AVEN_188160-1 [Araneus ventricosus]